MLNKVESKYLTKRNIIGLEQIPRPDGGGIYTGATISDVLEPIIVVDYVTLENYDLDGIETIDGVSPSNGSILLVANQTDASENGIYVYSTGGAWGRKTGLKGGYVISVKRGDTKAETLWIVQSDDFEEGVDDIDIIEYTFESQKPNILLNSNFDIWQRRATVLEIGSRSRSSNVATINTTYDHGYETGDTVQITNMDSSGYDDTSATITVVDADTFTYANTGSDEANTAETGGVVLLTSREAMTVFDQEFLADRWVMLKSSPDETLVSNGDGLTFEHGSSQYSGFVQVIPSRYITSGTFSIALQAKTSSGSPKMRIALLEWDGTVDNPDFDVVATWGSDPTLETDWAYAGKSDQATLTTSYQTISKENITASGNNLAFVIFTQSVSAGQVIDIKECQLIENSTIQDYQNPDIERELNECRKFYRKSYDLDTPPTKITDIGAFKVASSFGISNGNTACTIQTERMYDIPTVTLYGTDDPPLADEWTVSTGVNVGMTTDDESENGFVVVNDSGFSLSTSHVGGHYVCEVTTI